MGGSASAGAEATGDPADPPDSTSGGGPQSSSASSDDPDSSGDDDFLFDLPQGDLGPGVGCDPDDEDCGCTFVDVLFVIDHSGSMFQHQANLAAVFPEFVDVMVEALPPGTDLHVGITTQGGFWNGTGGGNWSQPSPGCVTDAAPYPSAFTTPDQAVHGDNGDQGRLYNHDGLRYFAMNTADDPGPLKDWFSSAATLPQAVSAQQDQVEMLSAAAAYTFHPANEVANAGFLRDEGAVLLIYFLTDTADVTPQDAESLAQIVREAKAGCGGDDCILTGGMVEDAHPCEPDYPRLSEFMNAFGKPPAAVGSISGGVGPFGLPNPATVEEHKAVLGNALAEVVAQTCAEIPPPEG